MSAAVSESDVSIRLRHEPDGGGEFGAFTSLDADILVLGKKAGEISGTIVNRQKIPERYFLSAMDGHSGDLQYLGVTVFEPRLGRTRLHSLRDAGDSDEFGFLYISRFGVDQEYKKGGSSDVGAHALRKVLHHPIIKGRRAGSRAVSSCIYILDPYEAMSPEEKERIEAENLRSESENRVQVETEESLRAKERKKQRMDSLARLDANKFLRNGFLQDEAVAKLGGGAERFVVAAHEHWEKPLKSHAEAAAVEFYAPPSTTPRPPTGRDAEILQLTKRMCRNHEYNSGGGIGRATKKRKTDGDSVNRRISEFQGEVVRLVGEGGSLVRSNALHAACANKDPDVARCILRMDPSCLDSRDVSNQTPLMVAAGRAAGSATIDGIPKKQPIIDLLLAAGARKDAVDSDGFTAYGTLKYMDDQYSQSSQAMSGEPVHGGDGSRESTTTPGLRELEAKLVPPGGPTAADRRGIEDGFIDYKEEDEEEEDGDY